VVLRPFFVAMVWAAILAYVTWPLFVRARALSGRPTLTALVFTGVLLIALGVPAVGLLVSIAQQAANLVAASREWIDAGAELPDFLAGLPGVGPQLEAFREQVLAGAIGPDLVGVGRRVSTSLGALAGEVASNAFSFAITLLALFSFYTNGEEAAHHARGMVSTLFPAARASLLDDIGSVVRATVFGLVGTALVQGAVAAVGFVLFGVPYALALGALVSVLSFVPGGPVLVWGTATVWLVGQDSTAAAVGNALWGALVVGSIDNVLRPILIRRSGSVPIPFLLVFFGVLGGLSAFGLLGLFVGPVILSVAFTLLSQMSTRVAAPEASGEEEAG
jgi:predicted PurR-regulated permease PerM